MPGFLCRMRVMLRAAAQSALKIRPAVTLKDLLACFPYNALKALYITGAQLGKF